MDRVNKLFGALKAEKVGTFQIEALHQLCDVFLARIKNQTSDAISVIVMTPHNPSSMNEVKIANINWTLFSVRSYSSKKVMTKALAKVTDAKTLERNNPQFMQAIEWDIVQDFELFADREWNDRTSYVSSEASVPYTVTLHSARNIESNRHGTELETAIELIPALKTLNFTLIRR